MGGLVLHSRSQVSNPNHTVPSDSHHPELSTDQTSSQTPESTKIKFLQTFILKSGKTGGKNQVVFLFFRRAFKYKIVLYAAMPSLNPWYYMQ